MRTGRGTWWPGVVMAAIAVGLIGFPLIAAVLGVLLIFLGFLVSEEVFRRQQAAAVAAR